MASPNKTRIQVATDPAFSNIVHDVNGAYTTELLIAEDALPKGVNLYARGMHGHPASGDSAWSTTVQFKITVPYANQLYYTAGTFNFTVPAGVTEVCIAATPGADYSTAGELLKTYIGRTTACAAGNNTVPIGISSITLSGKGAAGSTVVTSLSLHSYLHTGGAPSTLSGIPATIKANHRWYAGWRYNVTFTYAGVFSGLYRYSCYVVDEEGNNVHYAVFYSPILTNVVGTSTTAVVNGTTYTFPGGVGGAAAITNHTVAVNPAIGATINATIASGGTLSYSYSAYAISALGTLLGNNFSLSPVAANVGTYSGGIAAWRNAIPVTPGSTIPVRVGSGGAVNIIWGTGRTFPNSEV